MRCTKFRRQIDKLVDGALERQTAARLKVHLEKCAACRTYHQESLRLRQILESQPDPAFPDWLHHRILSECKLHEAKRKRSQKRLRLQLVPAALAVMISLFLGSLVGKGAFEAQSQAVTDTEPSIELSFGEVFLVDSEILPELSND